eukprot:TRINITY_DN31629_c0_g1_i1.p1 TRINITY_DN31629_c0_g1~~TRINITY_DN31629_c0_g1_i1.p1  ORF type:complete len:190 (+),score=34.34 TRINITY_DN31629_c0_g1_i1:184-753(+)
MDSFAMDLKVVKARVLGDDSSKYRFFVRFCLQNTDVVHAAETKAVVGGSELVWNQLFRIECSASAKSIQQEKILFELRRIRNTKTRNPLEGFFNYRKSKMVGIVEISVRDLSSCPDGCFSLTGVSGTVEADLEVLFTQKHSLLAELKPKSLSNAIDLQRRIRSLERHNCTCRGKRCSLIHHSQEPVFAV